MPTRPTFGEFFKEKRISLKKTLRQFCAENKLDPGNISKLERGLMQPPQGSDKLEEYAKYLHIKKGTDDWYMFFDLAAVGSRPHSRRVAERRKDRGKPADPVQDPAGKEDIWKEAR